MEDNPFKPYRFANALSHINCDKARIVEFSPDGLLLAVGSDSTPRTYSLSTPVPTLHNEFNGHAGRVTNLSFSSDSRFLASSSYDSTICLWDVSRRSLFKTLIDHNEKDFVSCVKFNRQSNMIASGSSDETVRLWDVNSGACLKVLPAYSGLVNAVDFNPDGSMIVACSRGGLCRIWDTATGNTMVTIKAEIPAVGSVKFSSDGKFVLVGNMDNTLRLWSMDWGRFITIYRGHEYGLGQVYNHIPRNIPSTFYGLDERYIVSGSNDGCLCTWEVVSGIMVQKFVAHEAPVLSISCHPIRNRIASAALEDIDTVKIWTQDYPIKKYNTF